MIYKNITEAVFIERINRFIAVCMVNGREEKVHVKNTGRCRELLIKGARVYLEKCPKSNRKTCYDLICVYKNGRLINMDAQAPNTIAFESVSSLDILKSGENILQIRREKTYKTSRFDIYMETTKRKIFIEVKGVTLEQNNIVLFPDAPTQRGIKHIKELMDAAEAGFGAYIIFIVQMRGADAFSPNYERHKEFGEALKEASASGVNIAAYDCEVTPESIALKDKVKILLD